MRTPKGFGKNYFTLTAIQAYAAAVTLHRQSVRTEAYRLQIGDESDEAVDDEDDALLLCISAPAPEGQSGRSAAHCNCRFRRIARHRLLNCPLANLNIPTYIHTHSALSPPSSLRHSPKISHHKGPF